jgi:hypothetical protein
VDRGRGTQRQPAEQRLGRKHIRHHPILAGQLLEAGRQPRLVDRGQVPDEVRIVHRVQDRVVVLDRVQ